jgi:hypothetical protein
VLKEIHIDAQVLDNVILHVTLARLILQKIIQLFQRLINYEHFLTIPVLNYIYIYICTHTYIFYIYMHTHTHTRKIEAMRISALYRIMDASPTLLVHPIIKLN